MRIFLILLVLFLLFPSLKAQEPPPWIDLPPGVAPPVEVAPPVAEAEVAVVEILEWLRRRFPEAIVTFCPLRNAFTVIATPEEQREIERLIKGFDTPPEQVTLEIKFVEVAVTDIGELGIELDMPELRDFEFRTRWGLPLTPAALEEGGGLWLERLHPMAFRAVLRALEKEGRASLLSAPRVTTLSEQPARIEVTRGVPYATDIEREVQVIGPPQERIVEVEITTIMDVVDAGIILEITPTVAPGTTLIELVIVPEIITLVDRIPIFEGVDPDLGWPVLDERILYTVMHIESGETIVLGGLIRQEEIVRERKIPLLGDIPLLGHLFRHKDSRNEKKNLLIFVTAYLVSPAGEKIVAGSGR